MLHTRCGGRNGGERRGGFVGEGRKKGGKMEEGTEGRRERGKERWREGGTEGSRE